MKRELLTLSATLVVCFGVTGQPAATNSNPEAADAQKLVEQKHFLACLAYLYTPAFWISYNGAPFFAPTKPVQYQQLEDMKAARSRYVALTDPAARHELAAKVLSGSGIAENWQSKLLLPLSATNQNLTPTLNKPVRSVGTYKLLQTLGNGDALLQEEERVYFVMNFETAGLAAGQFATNAMLVREGTRTYTTISGQKNTVEAFSSAALNREETAILNRASGAFQKASAALSQQVTGLRARQEFEDSKLRATDTNPHLEFVLGKAYLEGVGTDKNEKLGWEWLQRAADNGSGEAHEYLKNRSPDKASNH
jgi:TPR repeat protein